LREGCCHVKLLIAIVHDQCSGKLAEQLVAKGYRSTKLSSTGGFLRAGSTTLLIGVEADQVEAVLAVIKSACRTSEQLTPVPKEAVARLPSPPMHTLSGGAVVFVLNAVPWAGTLQPPVERP